jgi:hypothetical protein
MPDIREVMLRKAGPMPVWAWTALAAAFIAGFLIFKRKGSSAPGADSSTGSGGTAGQFQSSQSKTTTDANGNQSTTSFTATGPNSFLPGQITNTAGSMPYSGGDVYVNYPTSTAPADTGSAIQFPPANPTPAGPGRAGGYWYTPKSDTTSGDLVLNGYGISQAAPGDVARIEAIAADSILLEMANPQIDWSQHVAAGTAVFMPQLIGVPGQAWKMPPGASQNAPPGYKPPTQQTNAIVPVNGIMGPAGNQVPNSYFPPSQSNL